MKTKNVKLGFDDLHQGKIFYIAEPGHRILRGSVAEKLNHENGPDYITVAVFKDKDDFNHNRVVYDEALGRLVDRVNRPETYVELASDDSSIVPAVWREKIAALIIEKEISGTAAVSYHRNLADTKRCMFFLTDDGGQRIVSYPITQHHFNADDYSMRIFSNLRQARAYARKMPALPLGEYESIIDEIIE